MFLLLVVLIDYQYVCSDSSQLNRDMCFFVKMTEIIHIDYQICLLEKIQVMLFEYIEPDTF